MRFLTVLSLGATLLTWIAPSVMAVCCASCPYSSQCPDGSHCDWPATCCGVGQCNIACCNCDGGCRAGAGGLRKPFQASLQDGNVFGDCKHKLDELDLNKDGKISFLEWASEDGFAVETPIARLAERWLKLDIEDKGYLTIEEAYHRKA